MPRSAARPPRDDSSKTSAAEESEYVEPGVKEKKKGGRNTAMPRSAARPPRDDSSKASAAEESEYVEPGEEEKKKETGKRMLRALYDFKSAEKLDLNFSKGDLMELVTDMGNWWLAKKQDGTEGYVPSNYVALENTMESMDWFFGELSRPEAQQFLRADTADIGSFLIRKSQREQGLLVLSVRGPPRQDNAKPVDHYKIVGNESEGYHITPKITFSTVDQLVDHYKDCTDGMYCALTSPCPRPKPVQQDLSKETEDVWEIDRSTLTFSDKPIGSGQFGEVWKGMWKGTTEVAIKTMKEDSMDADKFLAEAAIMKKFRHPHLVKLYAVCSKQEPVLIVTEFMRMSNADVKKAVRNGYHMDRDKDVPEQVYELMVQCWDMEDEKRPDFATLQRFFFECRIDGSHIVDGRDDFDDDDDDPYNN
nr:hypothetical protein BaRGS_029594 [Batillaria attramentaria]